MGPAIMVDTARSPPWKRCVDWQSQLRLGSDCFQGGNRLWASDAKSGSTLNTDLKRSMSLRGTKPYGIPSKSNRGLTHEVRR